MYLNLLISFIVFVFGLSVGSFLNCLIYRLEKEERLSGRSYCPNCKHKLTWLDLIPIFSFLFLMGKCRYCSKKISWQYPVVEILTALVFLLIFNFQFSIFNEFSISQFLNLVFLWYIFGSLIAILVYDLKHYLIPDKILLPAIVVTLFYQIAFNFKFLITNSLWAGATAFLFFWLIFLISKGKWMGFGDCKLVILLGLVLGFPNILVAMFLAFSFGAIIGLALIILSKKKLKSQIPFAPFLIAGTFLAMILGQSIISWYVNLFAF